MAASWPSRCVQVQPGRVRYCTVREQLAGGEHGKVVAKAGALPKVLRAADESAHADGVLKRLPVIERAHIAHLLRSQECSFLHHVLAPQQIPRFNDLNVEHAASGRRDGVVDRGGELDGVEARPLERLHELVLQQGLQHLLHAREVRYRQVHAALVAVELPVPDARLDDDTQLRLRRLDDAWSSANPAPSPLNSAPARA
eukprot:scaffold7789_cov376-Prasinococcus_capsulatus_cf.AAC.6